jgi:exodeoxyribonuclease VII large subunit
MARAKKDIPVLSVSRLNQVIQTTLEDRLPSKLIVRGEISDFKRPASGHCYFLLKDEGGQIPCVMWAGKFRSVKFDCENGLEVLATGHVDVYVPGGKYQFYADKLEPAGVGSLQMAFEQMRKRLQAEGLFEAAHKRALPKYAMNIGVVTSGTGAAIVDITDSVYNRWPCAKLFVFDTPVQGTGSAEKIANAIKRANRLQKQMKLDVLIVGRGGGSMEDLWAFNEEPVARAIYASNIPVISAVGHEVDVTIADLVADARASTPTKAGVLAVPDYRQQLQILHSAKRRIHLNTRSRLQNCRNSLQTVLASRVFRSPLGPVQIASQRIDELSTAILNSLKHAMVRFKDRLDRIRSNVQKIEPTRLISKQNIALHTLTNENKTAISKILNKKQLQLTALENKLQALNPRSVLSRGYSLTMNERTGGLITKIDDVQSGDRLTTELAEGQKIHSRVKDSQPG